MRATKMKKRSRRHDCFWRRWWRGVLLTATAYAAAPGITGPDLQPDGATRLPHPAGRAAVYSWGYGCNGAPSGFAPRRLPTRTATMQVPGPTLIVTEGQTVTVTLTNNLPTAAGNTSILFPGFNVTRRAA
jgi:FtsP/CotA-like multicopper oxidase with cupredoxin domain